MRQLVSSSRGRILSLVTLLVLSLPLGAGAQAHAPLTPAGTVREFYKALREKRFNDALELSIYRPAIEGLSPAEMDELRPEFDKLSTGAGEIDIKGEEITGDTATVFVKFVAEDDPKQKPSPVPLMRVNGKWIIGDKENQEIVSKSGKQFFFNARIEAHQDEAKTMLQRINLGQIAYSASHNGLYGDLPSLIAAGLVPKDIEGTESTGYRFHLKLSPNAKSYAAGAEPAVYNRTGRLSFYLDPTGIKIGDVGGKPLVVP
jgi:hypothetical protein